MKSFPSTLNESGSMYNTDTYQKYRQTFDVERIKAININTSAPLIEAQLREGSINVSNYNRYQSMHNIDANNISNPNNNSVSSDKIYYEYPIELPPKIMALSKDYEWIYKYQVNNPISHGEKSGNSLKVSIVSSNVVPSMFNPMYGVNALGIIRNTPLLNDPQESIMDQYGYDRNIDDCSIRTLCSLSKDPNSPLGNARYKYADFMYCKDLGKVSNNHLITLRKFAHPVGDHIFKGSSPQYINDPDEPWSWHIEGDVGRLVTWFGTEDNKLEDIAKFSFNATWKEITAEIQQEETKADSPNTGIIGMLANSMSTTHNKGVGAGQVGEHNILTWLGSRMIPNVTRGIGANNELLRNYDNHKIYTPKNTMQSNHLYEGNLIFNNEFTLNFCYELRAYENINPRSAFLDLIGNILEVTYRRGKFWGGDRKIIGPAQDTSMFYKVHNMVDGAFDAIPGFLASFKNGGLNFSKILGSLGAMGKDIINAAGDLFNQVASGGSGSIAQWASYVQKLWEQGGAMDAVKGLIKNALGRPQLYAWQSLVSGDNVGLWHVTVGNPKNPILAIGNLIMTNATLQNYGPLGVDDFPTMIKVSVTLKHPRPRDITDISRMYTGGTNSIYYHFGSHHIKDFFGERGSGAAQETDSYVTVGKEEKEEDVAKRRAAAVQTSVYKDAQNTTVSSVINNGQIMTWLPNKGIISMKLNNYEEANVYPRDPSLKNDNEVDMMRKNTWADSMLHIMIQEEA